MKTGCFFMLDLPLLSMPPNYHYDESIDNKKTNNNQQRYCDIKKHVRLIGALCSEPMLIPQMLNRWIIFFRFYRSLFCNKMITEVDKKNYVSTQLFKVIQSSVQSAKNKSKWWNSKTNDTNGNKMQQNFKKNHKNAKKQTHCNQNSIWNKEKEAVETSLRMKISIASESLKRPQKQQISVTFTRLFKTDWTQFISTHFWYQMFVILTHECHCCSKPKQVLKM